jgi:hypothetical protein
MRGKMMWFLDKKRENYTYKVTKADGRVTYKIAELYKWIPPVETGMLSTVEFVLYGKSTFVHDVKQVEQIKP